jgi:deoxycytidine triphosphate deaminase
MVAGISYAEALKSSLRDRALDLHRYLDELRTANWSAEPRFRRALDMLGWYSTAVVTQLASEWESKESENARRLAVQGLINRFTEKERMVDHRLARAGQVHVPRALSRLLERELDDIGVVDVDPVVTVGPPGNFDTQVADLWRQLMGDISEPTAYRGTENFESRPRLCLLSLPYLEGTRALWQPIVVGHELAHLRLETVNYELIATLEALNNLTEEWVVETIDRYWIERLAEDLGQDSANPLSDVRTVYGRWLSELLCDLNVVRRYGPAGIAAVGEFLSVIHRSEKPTRHHPPLTLRLTMMIGYFRHLWGHDQSLTVAELWQHYMVLPGEYESQLDSPDSTNVQRSEDGKLPWDVAIVELLVSQTESLAERIDRWGEPYPWPGRERHVHHVGSLLSNGIPGDVLVPAADDVVVRVEDIVNAAWAVRGMAPEKIPIDRLATKAIDTLAFVEAWRAAEATIADLESADVLTPTSDGEEADAVDVASVSEAEAVVDDGSPGVLSAAQLERRIRDETLVVTPLLGNAIGHAGLDLRLSSSFIVFRHSSTVAFSALDIRQDPGTMQERVEKSWGESFVVHPGELVLAATLEYLVIPHDLCAQVVTRSSYGRLGLITATAVQVQPGSVGCITLELVNLSQTPIELSSGERIAQLVFHRISGAVPTTSGTVKYQYQTGPEFSRVHEDGDVPILRQLRLRNKES